MAEINIRSDAVDVEQVMARIRARIREKRGVDYTETDIQALAKVKLEKILDPRAVRSDLITHYRSQPRLPRLPDVPAPLTPGEPLPSVSMPPPPPPENYDFAVDAIYVSSRGGSGQMIALARRVLNPLLKLFFNPTPLVAAVQRQVELNRYLLEEPQKERMKERIVDREQLHHHFQVQIDSLRERLNEADDRDRLRVEYDRARHEIDDLHYEVLNNMVVELTRATIEVRNMGMRLESMASRLDFDERRARALEGVVQYKTGGTLPRTASPASVGAAAEAPVKAEAPVRAEAPIKAEAAGGGEDAAARQRRRRRRGRRRPTPGPGEAAAPGGSDRSATPSNAPQPPGPSGGTGSDEQ